MGLKVRNGGSLYNPSTWDYEAGGLSWVPGQPGLQNKTVSKKKSKAIKGKRMRLRFKKKCFLMILYFCNEFSFPILSLEFYCFVYMERRCDNPWCLALTRVFVIFFSWNRFSPCNYFWLSRNLLLDQTSLTDPFASAPGILGLKAWATTSSPDIIFLSSVASFPFPSSPSLPSPLPAPSLCSPLHP